MAVASSRNRAPAKLVCRAASFSSGLESAAGPGPWRWSGGEVRWRRPPALPGKSEIIVIKPPLSLYLVTMLK